MSEDPVPDMPVSPPETVLGGADIDLAIPVDEDRSSPVRTDKGKIMFEDYFPPLDLTDAKKKSVASWLLRDLKKCVKHVNSMKSKWATWRAVYMLEFIERFYPAMGMGADYPSGLLCEKVLEGMDRLQTAIFTARPLFTVDDKTSNMENIEFIHRAEWFLHTVFVEDLNILRDFGLEPLFEFLLDGSFILEADIMYERVPQRILKTYDNSEALMSDREKILNEADFQEAMQLLSDGRMARVLVEEDVLTKNGLQIFPVDKVDHLIPPGVYNDRDVRFRGRRMYLTESDMRIMASDDVGWYDSEAVERVIQRRKELRIGYRMLRNGEGRKEEFEAERLSGGENRDLAYNWRGEEDRLSADESLTPYENTFAVYRVTAKYAYAAGSDTKGQIPKFCVFDIEPESREILRARTYPHFEERRNYFHFKLGHAPKSYYGFGFGARIINDDFMEANAVNLHLDASAMSTFKPFLCVHPEHGGMVPFYDGFGPAKMGYVRNITDFKELDIKPPPNSLLNTVLPLTKTRSENRTSVTSLVQGRTESSDPRSPAQKAQMLLREAYVGIDAIIRDWNRTGWELLAEFVWMSCYEVLIYQDDEAFDGKIIFPGTAPDIETTNKITIQELKKKIRWKSQASSEYLNTELREQQFLYRFQFFSPLLQQLAVVNPELYKKYFIRWMRTAAQELSIRQLNYLIPTEEELVGVPAQNVAEAMGGMTTQIRSGQSPETLDLAPGGEE